MFLFQNAMEALWAAIGDLLPAHVPAENRHVALHFLRNLLEGQVIVTFWKRFNNNLKSE